MADQQAEEEFVPCPTCRAIRYGWTIVGSEDGTARFEPIGDCPDEWHAAERIPGFGQAVMAEQLLRSILGADHG